MKHIFNPVSDDCKVDDVILKEGCTIEMEDSMADKFLVMFPDKVVEVAGSSVSEELEEGEEPKVKRGRKPKVQE